MLRESHYQKKSKFRKKWNHKFWWNYTLISDITKARFCDRNSTYTHLFPLIKFKLSLYTHLILLALAIYIQYIIHKISIRKDKILPSRFRKIQVSVLPYSLVLNFWNWKKKKKKQKQKCQTKTIFLIEQ